MPPKTIKGSIAGSKLHGFKVLTVQTGAAASTMSAGALAHALSPETASALTPAAAKLTKADLVALNANPKMAAKLDLTASDLNSVKKAFSAMRVASNAKAKASDVSVTVTACCCPCCCAASVQVEVAIQ